MAAPQYSMTQLMEWVNHQISHSPYNIVVTNLTTCFHDGIALCAILHSYYPTPIPFDVLSHTCKKFNAELAFREAENVGIPYSTDPQELWMTRAPDESKVAFLVSQWRRYLEMEGDDVKADLEDKCDFLKAKFNEQGERNRGYQEALLQLKQGLASNPDLVQCHRCGDGLDKSHDKLRLTEGAPYHEECHRCYNCSADAGPLVWYQSEIWCQACQTASEEQLGSASGSATAAELESRLLEIKQIATVRREKGSDPFREMERKREEERARKLEAFRQKQRERAEKLEADLRQDLAEAEEAAKAAAEEKRRQEEEEERQRLEEAERRRQEEARAREEEERRAQMRREEEQRLRAEAVQAEAVSDFDGLKQKRGEELEQIKATRAGLNPFREMERIQAEEQKRRRFSPRTTPISERAPQASDETKGTVRILEKTRRVTTNPFAEMERKRQQERMARMKGFVSQSKLQVEDIPSVATETPATPAEETLPTPEPVADTPAAEPVKETPASPISEPAPGSPVPVQEPQVESLSTSNEVTPASPEPPMASSQYPELDDLDASGVSMDALDDLSEEQDVSLPLSEVQVPASPSKSSGVLMTPRSSEAELMEMSLEADLLLEAADTLEAQRITIQEQMTLIQEQEIILIKQKESISELQRELAALQSEMKRNRKSKA